MVKATLAMNSNGAKAMHSKGICVLALLCAAIVLIWGHASAQGLIVGTGSKLTLSGSTLDLNCQDIHIKDGGVLDLRSGTIEECGRLTVDPGGTVIWGSVTINYCYLDSDEDGLPDYLEDSSCTDTYDADTDDDGIPDGVEDANHNGLWDGSETNPCEIDSDGDGIQDGTELGYTLQDIGSDTDTGVFQPDLDPTTLTDPLDADTDDDGWTDGEEDKNGNGRLDPGETDPNDARSFPRAMPWLFLLLLDD